MTRFLIGLFLSSFLLFFSGTSQMHPHAFNGYRPDTNAHHSRQNNQSTDIEPGGLDTFERIPLPDYLKHLVGIHATEVREEEEDEHELLSLKRKLALRFVDTYDYALENVIGSISEHPLFCTHFFLRSSYRRHLIIQVFRI